MRRGNYEKKFFILFATLVALSVCGISACTNEPLSEASVQSGDAISFEVAKAMAFTDSQHTAAGLGSEVALINSVEDLVSWSDACNLPYFDKDDEKYDEQYCREVRENYSEAYFGEKSLVFLYIVMGGYDLFRIDSLEAKGEEIVVTLARPDEDYNTMAVMTACICIIEVDKTDVGDARTVKLEYIRKGSLKDFVSDFTSAQG